MNMVDITYKSTQVMINILQQLKGKTKLKFYKNLSNYYIEMKRKNFQTYQQDTSAKNAQGISKIYHEIVLLMRILQTKPQIKNKNINYYDLYYTVIKTRDENKNIDTDTNDYINFNDIISNHYIGNKKDNVILR